MTTFEILTLLIGSGVVVSIINGIFKMGKVAKGIENIKTDLESIKFDIRSINLDIKNVDARLNRLEGAFFERGQWESKIYKVEKITLEKEDN